MKHGGMMAGRKIAAICGRRASLYGGDMFETSLAHLAGAHDRSDAQYLAGLRVLP
jgi:muconate cycloisomerase